MSRIHQIILYGSYARGEYVRNTYLIIFDKTAFKISEDLFEEITEYIDDKYADDHTDLRREYNRMSMPCQNVYDF